MDIPLGVPWPDPEVNSIGYMPFKWRFYATGNQLWNEPMVADPILFEMERAFQRERFWAFLWNKVFTKPVKIERGFGFMSPNTTRGGHLALAADNPKDDFSAIVTKMLLEGQTLHWNERYQTPERLKRWVGHGDWNYGRKFDEITARLALGPGMGNMPSLETMTLKDVRAIKGTAAIDAMTNKSVYAVGFKNDKLTAQQRGEHDYDKVAEENGGEEFKTKLKSNWDMFSKKYDKYGAVRTLMLDWGIAHMFDTRIMAPPSMAAHIAEGMTSFQLWRKWNIRPDVMERVGYMAPIMGELLMCKYKADNGVFETALKDQGVVNTFARSFLEYFGYTVLPQWKLVDKMIIDFTNGKGEEEAIGSQIQKLCDMVQQQPIVDWLFTHIRFKNAQMRIVDYSNATDEQKTLLDQYREKLNIPSMAQKQENLKYWESLWNKFGDMEPAALKAEIDKIEGQIKSATYEARYIGDHNYEEDLRRYYQKMYQVYNSKLGIKTDTKMKNNIGVAYMTDKFEDNGKSPEQIREEERKKDEEEQRQIDEQRKKDAEEAQKRLAEEAKRQEEIKIAEAKIKEMEAIRKQEQAYETILEKMVADPKSVSEKELNSLGDDVKNLKQEAENRISQLPREERELKLALIRGDHLSEKTFSEVKETAIGLHGNLQAYIEEVNKIPVGNIMAIQKPPGGSGEYRIPMADPDSVDMADD